MTAVAAALLLHLALASELHPVAPEGQPEAVTEEQIAALLESLGHQALVTAPGTAPVTVAASASSHGTWRDRVYAPGNVLDRDFRTAWVEGKKGHGIGESLSLTIAPEGASTAKLRGLLILPGYTKNPGMWRRNGRPQRVRAELGEVTLTLVFDDARRAQIFLLPEPRRLAAMTIRLTLEKVYAGTHYRDTSIAEVRLLFW